MAGQTIKDYSDKTAEKLDLYVKDVLTTRYEAVIKSLEIYSGAIENMVKVLYEEETIEGKKVRKIISNFESENGLPTRLQIDESEKGEKVGA